MTSFSPRKKQLGFATIALIFFSGLGAIAISNFSSPNLQSNSSQTEPDNFPTELQRTLDFIEEDVEGTTAMKSELPEDFILPAGGKVLLSRQTLDNKPVIYYLAPSNNTAWLPPNTLFKWTPIEEESGAIIDGIDDAKVEGNNIIFSRGKETETYSIPN